MKALPIIYKIPEEYKRHVVTPGHFHTTINYMVAGHKCNGFGYSEVLVESILATSGWRLSWQYIFQIKFCFYSAY